MKKAGRKLIISVFVLIVAMSLAVSSTFAWFSMTSTPSVNDFNLEVTTSEGLLIAIDAKDSDADPKSYVYTSSISKTAIESLIDDNFKLGAVTSSDGETFMDINGVAEGEDDYMGGGYFEFDILFYSNIAQTVSLADNGNFAVSNISEGESAPRTLTSGSKVAYVKAWEAIDANEYGYNHEAIEQNADIVTYAADALRISFDNHSGTDDPVIWYPNPDKGFNKDCTITGNEGELSVTAGVSNKNLGIEYINKTEGLEKTPSQLPTTFSTNFYDYQANFATPGNYIIDDELLELTLNAAGGYYGKLTVRIWIEGYDGDCFDSIMDDVLTIGLKFKGTKVS